MLCPPTAFDEWRAHYLLFCVSEKSCYFFYPATNSEWNARFERRARDTKGPDVRKRPLGFKFNILFRRKKKKSQIIIFNDLFFFWVPFLFTHLFLIRERWGGDRILVIIIMILIIMTLSVHIIIILNIILNIILPRVIGVYLPPSR